MAVKSLRKAGIPKDGGFVEDEFFSFSFKSSRKLVYMYLYIYIYPTKTGSSENHRLKSVVGRDIMLVSRRVFLGDFQLPPAVVTYPTPHTPVPHLFL